MGSRETNTYAGVMPDAAKNSAETMAMPDQINRADRVVQVLHWIDSAITDYRQTQPDYGVSQDPIMGTSPQRAVQESLDLRW